MELYPVPQIGMEFANINFMQPLLSEEIRPDSETAMKDLVEKYSLVRQSKVRVETTKDKAGALPPTVYSKEQDFNTVDFMETMEGLGNDLNTEKPIVFTIVEEEKKKSDLFVRATCEGGDAPQITFVNDCQVARWQLLKRGPRQMNMKPTQEMTFLIGRTKILPLLKFQELGSQYVPIFGLTCKVRLS